MASRVVPPVVIPAIFTIMVIVYAPYRAQATMSGFDVVLSEIVAAAK